MIKRHIAISCVLAAAIAGGCGLEKKKEEHQSPTIPANEVWITPKQIRESSLATTDVMNRPIANTLMTTGKVAFSDAGVAHVFSPVNGRITRLLVNLGDHVTAGMPLATVVSPDIGSASSDLEKAEADLVAAHNDYERQRELFEGHAAARRDFEGAESVYRKALAERNRAAQKNSLLSVGGRNGNQEFVLRAPIDGDVVARNVSIGIELQGQYSAGSATELFTIGNLDPVWVLADVFEVDLARVHRGAPVTVSVVAYPDHPFTGSIDWISGALDPSTRSAKVRCTIRNGDHLLRPEMYATVSVATDGREKLAVPRAAVVRVGDQMVAFVDKGSAPDGRERFERRIVTIDENEAGDFVPVLRGLDRGDKVVSSGVILLTGSGA
jgi:cobalt-zinc-cadmium efflux system membrane fusion protein